MGRSYAVERARQYARLPRPSLKYRIRKCKHKGCHVTFILGPLDPDVECCPIHAYAALREKR